MAKGTFQLQKKISITPWRQDFANGKSVFLVKSWCSSEELMQQNTASERTSAFVKETARESSRAFLTQTARVRASHHLKECAGALSDEGNRSIGFTLECKQSREKGKEKVGARDGGMKERRRMGNEETYVERRSRREDRIQKIMEYLEVM